MMPVYLSTSTAANSLQSTGSALSPNPAHLLISALRVNFRLQSHAVGHRLRKRTMSLDRGGWRAQNRTDGDFAAFEQAGAQDAGGGEAESVAGGAAKQIVVSIFGGLRSNSGHDFPVTSAMS